VTKEKGGTTVGHDDNHREQQLEAMATRAPQQWLWVRRAPELAQQRGHHPSCEPRGIRELERHSSLELMPDCAYGARNDVQALCIVRMEAARS